MHNRNHLGFYLGFLMILPLEQFVTSQELSQKLKDAGFPQDTHFYWRLETYCTNMAGKNDVTGKMEERPIKQEWKLAFGKGSEEKTYAAPTVGELGVVIPKWCPYPLRRTDRMGRTYFGLQRTYFGLHLRDLCGDAGLNDFIEEKTEAEARSQEWLYLKGRGLI